MKFRKRIRQRWKLAIAVLLVVSAGLASRAFPFLFPASWGKYPGDALWAAMVLFGVAFLWPRISPSRLAAIALGISYAVELSQIYQGAWLNTIRSYHIGHLILGSGFDWVDLVAYAIGVACGFVADVCLFFRPDGCDATHA